MTFGTVRSSSFQFLALPGFLWDFLLRQGEWELELAVSLNAGIEKMWGWDFVYFELSPITFCPIPQSQHSKEIPAHRFRRPESLFCPEAMKHSPQKSQQGPILYTVKQS